MTETFVKRTPPSGLCWSRVPFPTHSKTTGSFDLLSRSRWLLMAAVLTLLAASHSRVHAAFGVTTQTDYYKVDTGSHLVFYISKSNGGMTSIQYNGQELNISTASGLASGLGSTGTSTSVTSDASTVIITVSTDSTNGVVQDLTHYYIVRNGYDNIYMATFAANEPGVGELRWITRLQSSLFTSRPPASDNAGTTGAIESSDVFGHADGTTTSKYYGNQRAKDMSIRGITGPGVGVFMAYGSRESSSGGPFSRDIQNQSTEVYTYMNSGHAQTEAWRLGVLYGPYTLVFTDGSAPSLPDIGFISTLGLRGYVDAASRGTVAIAGISGRDTNFAYTVGFSNATAQYWADADPVTGGATGASMKPGSYTMKVYKNELAVYTGSVTVTAGATTTVDPIAITADPSQVVPLWRIGNWDGSPTEFLNGDKVTYMHPSDVRMSPWTPGTYVVGVSTPATGMPCYQWKSVNANQVIQFNLAAAQTVASTIRVGITTAYAGGRPNITINKLTTALQSSSTQPDSRTLTVGSYRGNNTTYTFNVPASALVAGTNTLTVSPISGSSGTTYLSPGYSLDCIDMYQGASTVVAPTPPATLTATGGSTQIALAWDASSNATSYTVLRGAASGGPYTAIAPGVTSTSYTDTGLTNGVSYYYVVTASNSSGTSVYSTEANATDAAISPPVISSSLTVSTQVGQAFTYQITATNAPASYAATGLPAGVSLDPASGVISGTPTTADTFTVNLAATNAGGTGTAALSLIVFPAPVAPPVVASVTGLPARVGTNFTFQISATNNPTSFAASGLPPGLTMDTASGVISGSPTTPGVFTVTLSATNSGGTGTATTTVTVAANLPEVTLTAPIPQVVAGSGGFGEFTLTRSGDDLSTALVVAYAVKGTAVGGSDYTLLKGTKKLKPGKASANVKIFPIGDGAGPGLKRTVKLTLVPSDSYLILSGKVKVKIIGR